MKSLCLQLSLVLFTLLHVSVIPASATTTVSGTISSDTVWTAAASPYYVSSTVTLAGGTTLTVEPGVVIKFAQGQGLAINGTLSAIGTSAARIYFTDYRDDSAGGDTNGDGSITVPAPGWWRGIEIASGGFSNLTYCVISYGGSASANIYKTGTGTLAVANSTISDSLNQGIYLYNAETSATISNSTISDNLQHGIYGNGSSPATITGNTINYNGRYGIYASVSNPASFSINGNSFLGNVSAPIGVTAASSGVAIGSGNSYTGAAYTLVEGGSVSSNQTWGAGGAALVYYLTGSVTVDAGKTLTIQPRTVIKSAPAIALYVYGSLNAQATSGNEIVFTDFNDDTAGGDSNGNGTATTPVPGGWRGIEVYDNGSATLEFCSVRYAGSSYANVYKTGANGALTISNSQILYSLNQGIYLNGSGITTTVNGSGTTINGNLQNGVYAVGASPATISGVTISNNGKYGIYASVATPDTFSVNGSNFSGNASAPIGVTAASSGIAIGSGNSGLSYTLVEGGSVSSNQSWGVSGAALVYYLSGAVSIDAGKTLTILPRTVIKSAVGVPLYVNGSLNALASSGSEIVFTDFRDDTAGGDSNGNGTASAPVPGGWYGIQVNDNGSATLTYCSVRYAGSIVANVYKTGVNGALAISNSQLLYSLNHGVHLSGAGTSTTISGSTISGNLQHGIYAIGTSPATISGNTISGNALYGIYANVSTPASFVLSANSFTGNIAAPIGVTAASSGIVVGTDNTFSGSSSKKHIHVEGGTIASNQTWGNGGTIVYYIADNVSINANQTLTVQPGTVIKFFTDRALLFSGSLNAPGTAGKPIYFTDYRDDAVGGDSNLDGTASNPAPGGWRGIELNNYAGATLNYCVIRYGSSSSAQQANLYKTGEGNVSISNSTISNGAYRGISIIGATGTISITTSIIKDNAAFGLFLSGAGTVPIITRSQISGSNIGIYAESSANPLIGGSSDNGNDIFDNITYSVQNTSPSVTINARYNWWGRSDGPQTTGINKISSNIITDNYLAASVFSNAPFVAVPPATVLGTLSYSSGTTTWDLAHSPYYINGNVTVDAGATLVIDAGVVVKFANNVGLDINGTLHANGTAGSGRIYITDYRDDTVGGDNNSDGAATVPAPGWWRGILVNNGGGATIANTVVRYGGSNGPNSSNIYKTGASGSLTITDSVISYSSAYGLYLNDAKGTTTSITGSTFSYNNADGILAGSDSPASISGSTFTGNKHYGIYASVSNSATFSINTGNTFSYNTTAPIGVTAAGSGITVAAGNSFNGANYIRVEDGSIVSSQTWGNGHPHYYLAGNVTVDAGPMLTINPGAFIKFAQNVGLHINGTLKAEGTSGSRIAFTDFRDDSLGGDSNGDASATVPAPGWWRGILVNNGAYATIVNCDIRYGGSSGPNSSNVYKTGANGSLTITNSIVSYSLYYGLYLNDASAATTTITGNTFSYNNYDGILAGANSPVAISGNTFAGNGRYGIYASVSNPATFSVNSGNSFTYNVLAPIGVTAASAGISVLAGNSFSGTNYIRVEDGVITTSQIWGNGHPYYYLAGNITVPAGLTLTVKPASIIKFAQDVGLWVNGTLDARGELTKKIYFSDIRDDSAGGDNNADGSASAPVSGWWRSVNILDGGAATLDYCIIRYGGRRDPGYANLYKNGAGALTVTHSEFAHSGNHGIYLKSATGTVSITDSTFASSVYDGIDADGTSTATIRGNTFTGNGRWGIYANLSNPAGFSVSGNNFSYNSLAPIGVSAAGSGIAVATDNSFIGRNYIYVEDGTIAGNPTWGNTATASYYLAGNVTVPAGLKLTIQPGTIIKFAQNVGLHINGSLDAIGSPTKKIFFSDIRDDESGGDTNGDGSASVPTPGWWRGILVNDAASAALAHCVVRYGGSSGPNSSNVYKTGSGSFSISNSTIANSSYYGLYLNGAAGGSTLTANTYASNGYDGIYATGNSPFTVTGSTFSGNLRYGVYNDAIATAAVSISSSQFTANSSAPINLTAAGSGAQVSDDSTLSGPLMVEGGNIGNNITWSNKRVYYIKGGISVPVGATLTLTAGNIIKMAQNVNFDISGGLNAMGTSENRIYFTDYRDDTLGGDSNGDGTASAPAAGWWWGINVLNGGVATLNYTTVRYAAGNYYGGWPYYTYRNFGSVYKTGSGSLSMSNSVVENASGHGIWIVDSSATHTIGSTTVQTSGGHGILLQNTESGVTVNGCTVNGNTNTGIEIQNSAATITGNTVSGTTGGYGIHVTGVALPASIAGNTLSGNSSGSIAFAADSSDTEIDNSGIPNIFSGPIMIEGGTLTRNATWRNNRVYYILGGVGVSSGITLTVPAGRIVKLGQNVNLDISGVLSAPGTAGSRVYFTDYRDDTLGGDSNADESASAPSAGWWWGINVLDGGSATLNYTTVRYAAGGYYGGWPYYTYRNFGSVYKVGSGSLSVSNSVVENASGNGLWVVDSSGTHTINGTTVKNNGGHGIAIENSGAAVTVSGDILELNSNSGIYVGSSSPLIQGNTIRYNITSGISVAGATSAPNIFRNSIFANAIGIYSAATANPLVGGSAENGNNIFNNTNFGVQNASADIQLNATYNWWGTPTGPYHVSLNPLGTGNTVSDYVDFGQFLSSPAVAIAMEEVQPASKSFGHVTTGSASAPQIFTVTNNGTQSLQLSSISITGMNINQFRIIQNMCEGQNLVNGGSCTITAVYEPTVSGPAQAQLTIVSNDIYAPTRTVPLTGAGSVTLPFRDDFSSGTKSSGWFIINEDPAKYTLAESIGNLRIYTTPTNFWGNTNNVKNLFVIALPDDVTQYVATTKMLFPNSLPTWTPNQNYQQGGLMLMAEKNGAPDLDNYMRAQYAFDGGRRFETSYDINSAPGGYTGGVQTGVTSATPVWIRIIRQSTEFRADYSLDGINYTLITSMIGPWNINYAGLNALNGDQSSAPSIPVDFDYFEIYELPSISAAPQSAAFGTIPIGNTSSTLPFVITNNGPGQLTINSIVVNGTDAGMFSVANGTCGSPPAVLAAHTNCMVTITFTPASEGSKFANLALTTNDIVTPVTNLSLTGTGKPFYQLTLSLAGSGSGSVNSDADFSCTSGTCYKNYLFGSTINLYATGSTSTDFIGWSGACSGTGTCQVSIDSNKTVVANFALKTYAFTSIGGAGGTITPVGTTIYNHGSNVNYMVTPDAGYHIDRVLFDGYSRYIFNSKVSILFPFPDTWGDHVIEAYFALDTVAGGGFVRILRSAVEYQTLQDAYNAAEDGDTIQLRSGSLNGPMFDGLRPISVTLKGGYDSTYSEVNRTITSIPHQMLIRDGSIKMDRIAVR